MKTILFIIAFISIVNAQPEISSIKPDQDHNVGLVSKQFEAPTDSIAPDTSGMGTLTSVELTQKMMPGWNLSNSLEALPNETSWGNPLTTQRLMDSIKAAGFKSIRLPVAWYRTTDTSIYIISATWLNRVEEVVNYALNTGMYVIINEHWDYGWQQPTYEDSAYVNNRLATMWEQIAIHFRDYGDHLLFAGLNEVAVTNDWGLPTPERAAVENSFCQTFVNAVRSTGGRNFYRYLLVQGYRTDINATVASFVIPTDVVPNRLIIEDHYYDPYNFTLNSTSNIIEWGMYATDPSRTETWANESWADGQFQKLKIKYVDQGYGVVIGEYGALARPNLVGTDLAIYEAYRKYYMQYITRSMERHSLVPMYWEGSLFNRSTGAHINQDILDAIIDTSTVEPVVGVRESLPIPKSFLLEQNYPNPFNPSTLIGYQLPISSFVNLTVYDALGKEIKTLVNKYQNAGKYFVQFNASDLPSGVYFYRLDAGTFHTTKKLLLLK